MFGRIAKIKRSNPWLSVTSVEKRGDQNEKETTFKSSEDPHGDLLDALAALERHIRTILGWPDSYAKDCIKITGVSFSYNDEFDVEGAVISGQVSIDTADAPFVFNTPHLPYDQYSPTGVSKLMPTEAQQALRTLQDEAVSFVEGKRAQGDMFQKPPGGKVTAAEQVVPA